MSEKGVKSNIAWRRILAIAKADFRPIEYCNLTSASPFSSRHEIQQALINESLYIQVIQLPYGLL